MPVTGSISSTWLTMSFRTAKGRTLSFTEAPSPRCCQAPPAGQVSEHMHVCARVWLVHSGLDSVCVCRDAKCDVSGPDLQYCWQGGALSWGADLWAEGQSAERRRRKRRRRNWKRRRRKRRNWKSNNLLLVSFWPVRFQYLSLLQRQTNY